MNSALVWKTDLDLLKRRYQAVTFQANFFRAIVAANYFVAIGVTGCVDFAAPSPAAFIAATSKV